MWIYVMQKRHGRERRTEGSSARSITWRIKLDEPATIAGTAGKEAV